VIVAATQAEAGFQPDAMHGLLITIRIESSEAQAGIT